MTRRAVRRRQSELLRGHLQSFTMSKERYYHEIESPYTAHPAHSRRDRKSSAGSGRRARPPTRSNGRSIQPIRTKSTDRCGRSRSPYGRKSRRNGPEILQQPTLSQGGTLLSQGHSERRELRTRTLLPGTRAIPDEFAQSRECRLESNNRSSTGFRDRGQGHAKIGEEVGVQKPLRKGRATFCRS